MRELFIAELVRLRKPAVGYAALHLVSLVVLGQPVDLLQQPMLVYELGGCVHVLAALAFGAWQLRAHRGPSAWLFLLHRPLRATRIGAAILGAGAVSAALAVAVPIVIGLVAQATLTVRVVDTRHLGLALAGALLAVIGQLAGALLVIAPGRHAFAVLSFLLWPVFAHAVGPRALIVHGLIVAWLAGLALVAFRPDPAAAPRRFLASAALGLPVAAGVAFTLGAVVPLVVQLAWIVRGDHPLNSQPLAGGYVEASRADARALLGVAGREPPLTLIGELSRWPRRHALTNLRATELDDARRGTRWVFSHDQMRFVGMDRARVERRGVLDVPGGFAAPPVVVGGLVVDATGAYRIDEPTGGLVGVVRMPAGEVMAAPPQRYGRAWAVLSSHAVTLFDAGDPAVVIERIALPVPIGALGRVDLVEDGAGYLVSIVSGRGSLDGNPPGRHVTLRVERGAQRRLAERTLRGDFPAVLRDSELVISPGLLWLRTEVLAALADPAPLVAQPPRTPEPAVLALALILSVTGAAFAARRARALGLPRRHVAAWTLAALGLGWPMALTFAIVERQAWRRSAESLALPPTAA
jgi:hypothetical protein